MATLASILALTLTPYVQPVPVAPYSLKSGDTQSLLRFEALAQNPSPEGSEATGLQLGPILSFGAEFLKGSKGPFVKGGVGLQLIHKDFRIHALPEFMVSTGSKWDAAPLGGRGYRFTLGMDINLGPLLLQPAMRITGHSKRKLGDPEHRTELDQEASEAYLVRASLQPEEGFYAAAEYTLWKLSEARIKSPGLDLRFAPDSVGTTKLAAGWSWSGRRASLKWCSLAGISNNEEHGYRARGMMDDLLLHTEKLEAEMAWAF